MANPTTSADARDGFSLSVETETSGTLVNPQLSLRSVSIAKTRETTETSVQFSDVANNKRRVGLSWAGQVALAGIVLAAYALVFAMISVGSEHINPKFIEEHMRYYKVTLILCSLGVLSGIYHVYKLGYTSDQEPRITFFAYAALYLMYFGMAFWMVVMFTYSASLAIMILSWVACALAPLILILYGKWRRVSKMHRVFVTNLDPDHVTEAMIKKYFKDIGGTIADFQMQPVNSAVITYQTYAEADFAIQTCNNSNKPLELTKIECRWCDPEDQC